MPQIIHAAIQFVNEHPEKYKEWFELSNYVIVLAVKNEEELLQLTNKLDNKCIKYSKFYEPDIGNVLTSIAIVPGPEVKKMCSSIPLAGKLKGGI